MSNNSSQPDDPKEFPTEGGDHKGNENPLSVQTPQDDKKKPKQPQIHPDYLQNNGEYINFDNSKEP